MRQRGVGEVDLLLGCGRLLLHVGELPRALGAVGLELSNSRQFRPVMKYKDVKSQSGK